MSIDVGVDGQPPSPIMVGAGSFGAAALEDAAPAPLIGGGTIVARSAYDNVYSLVARRSEHSARIVRENAAVIDALRTTANWVISFCKEKGIDASLVIVDKSMTPEGAIALHIRDRRDEQ